MADAETPSEATPNIWESYADRIRRFIRKRRIAEAARDIVVVVGSVYAEIGESLSLFVEALDYFHGKMTAFGPG